MTQETGQPRNRLTQEAKVPGLHRDHAPETNARRARGRANDNH